MFRPDRAGASFARNRRMLRHLVLLLLLPVSAYADEEGDRLNARTGMYSFAHFVHDATTAGDFNGIAGTDPATCDETVKKGTAAGLKPTDTFDTDDSPMLWRKAPDVCAEYKKMHALAKVIEKLVKPWESITAFASLTRPDGSPDPSVRGDAYRASVEEAKKCVKIIDEAIQAGVKADVKYAPNGNSSETTFTLTEARKKCSDWVSWGTGAAKADDDRAAAEVAALKAKYGKLGITGDRLTYLVKYGYQPVFGKGCGELSGKALKTAPAFYQLGQDDIAWIVYKTEFKGDKQISYTSKRYRKDGNWSCK